ncbi:Parathyroid hormone-like protein [Scophthalmus maximus]|uniref:Parathyroid hormone-like protein n=1 Tax=Scophthalmus maximus TaxID=52904 RepID=A0A2U9BEB4_SCOMX|nr:Parathyroid hormone-like protein [Scophthalmus maximus]KAF0021430.1 hypothetical protein F2P81_026317 [Scophthalmus maximus]
MTNWKFPMDSFPIVSGPFVPTPFSLSSHCTESAPVLTFPPSPRSRRAVSEHQLMHDRGRNIQSLKRLIWLSSAMEGLHTAQARSAAFNPTKVLEQDLDPAPAPAARGPQPARVPSLLRDFFNPYITQLPDRES